MKECVGCHGITEAASGNLVGHDTLDCSEFEVAAAVAGGGAGANLPPPPAALPPVILKAPQAASTQSSSGLTPSQIALLALGGTAFAVSGVVNTKWDDVKERLPAWVRGIGSSIAFGIETDDAAQTNLTFYRALGSHPLSVSFYLVFYFGRFCIVFLGRFFLATYSPKKLAPWGEV